MGVALGLLWVREEVDSVEIWESWLKKEDMSGRRLWLTGLSLMLCSTWRGMLLVNTERQGGGWVMYTFVGVRHYEVGSWVLVV